MLGSIASIMGPGQDICVLVASPEGSLDSFEELGVLSHHLV